MAEEILIVGQVEAIYYENLQNFYKVMRISVDQDESFEYLGHEVVVTGTFVAIHLDTVYEFYGQITQHPKYGEQFAVTRYQQKTPSSYEGLIQYLSSYRFKGIGSTLATRIVDHLGLEAIDLIIEDSKSLEKITGLTQKNAENLRQTLIDNQGTERIFIQLNDWGFGPKLADKIYQQFESQTLEIIKENPYQLIEKIEGIGFNKADNLARELGFQGDSLDRIIASLYVTVLDSSYSQGDTFIWANQALDMARNLLEESRNDLISASLLEEGLKEGISRGTIIDISGKLMIPSLYYAELGISQSITAYFEENEVVLFDDARIEESIQELESMTHFIYDASQKSALITALSHPISIITGGPGTGKTTLIKGLIQLHALLHDYHLEKVVKNPKENPILLAAPTGRAAKRMQETTGIQASTIHRLIGYTISQEFYDHSVIELEGSLLIIDEMSMVDTWLMNWLFQAIPSHMQVILVGDQDQLPSVGPGKVFTDLIDSEIMPVLSLTKIYRQNDDSSIISLAHTIRKGNLPQDFLMKLPDRTFIPARASQIPRAIEKVVKSAISKGYDANSLQVLAPMYKGPGGINALNTLLQEIMNPPKASKRELLYFDTIFREGDKVLQLVNNSEDGVYNGDIGMIVTIQYKDETESKNNEIIVNFDNDNEIIYPFSNLDQLKLAYCTSIHKAQGSEYPLVILPIVTTFSMILQKDLLYTAVTRAQKSLVMMGNPDSFFQAVSTRRPPRNTNLKDMLYEINKKDKKAFIEKRIASPQLNCGDIDPMIGMEGISPYDFMDKSSDKRN